MNSIERLTRTLAHQPTDRLPVYPFVNSISRKALGISYAEWTTDVDKCAACIIQTTDALDLDCILTFVDLSVEAADFGQDLLYFDDQAVCPDHNRRAIEDEDAYETLQPLDPKTTPRMRKHIALAEKLVAARGQEKPVIGFVFGPFGVLTMLRGQEDLFVDCMVAPELVHPALQAITQTTIALCDALIDAGVYAVMIDTLYASAAVMREDMWQEFEGTYIQQICDHIHARGCRVMLHNCSESPYLEAQIERMHPCLISFWHVPHGCISYAEAKQKFGGSIALMGGIDPTWLATASLDAVRQASQKAVDTLASGGGFVLATGCEYPAYVNQDKASVMVEVAKAYDASQM